MEAKKGRRREQVLDMRVAESVEDRDKALQEAMEAKAAAARHEAKVTELITIATGGATGSAADKRAIWELEQQITILQSGAQATSAKVCCCCCCCCCFWAPALYADCVLSAAARLR